MNALWRRLLAFFRSAFTENIGLKLFAFVFALGLFGFLHGQEDVQQRTIPVGVVTLPPESGERVLMTRIPPSIHVTLRGTTRSIDQLIQTGITPVELDLRKGYKKVITFTDDMFSLPRGIDVVIIDPPSIELEWEKVITRELPLQAAITGQPAPGYVVKGEPAVDPTKITAKGPVSQVETMQFGRLAAFDVSGLTEGVWSRRIAIDSPPNHVSYIGPQSATVTVTIARRVSEAKFTKRPIEVVGVPNSVAIPRTVDVTVIGPPEVVRALREDQVVPRVNLNQLKDLDLEEQPHGSATVRVTVDLAKAEAEIQPPSVTVKW